MTKAVEAHKDYSEKIHKLDLQAKQLQKFAEEGAISKEKLSVKAKTLLATINGVLGSTGSEVMVLLPTSSAAEKKCGYTKYHLLIELVKTEFKIYGEMKEVKAICHDVQENKMDPVQGKQLLSEIASFDRMVLLLHNFKNYCYDFSTTMSNFLFILVQKK